MTTHTPGPWTDFYANRDHDHPNGWQDCVVASLSPMAVLHGTICTLQCRDKTEQVANAHLIAAAPALLTVAKGSLGYLMDLPTEYQPDKAWFKPLEEAIAQAEGQ